MDFGGETVGGETIRGRNGRGQTVGAKRHITNAAHIIL
jgi:hypothetical protein